MRNALIFRNLIWSHLSLRMRKHVMQCTALQKRKSISHYCNLVQRGIELLERRPASLVQGSCVQGRLLGMLCRVGLWPCSSLVITRRVPLPRRISALLWSRLGTAALGACGGRCRNCRCSCGWLRKDFGKVGWQIAQERVFLDDSQQNRLTVCLTYVGTVNVWREFPDRCSGFLLCNTIRQ